MKKTTLQRLAGLSGLLLLALLVLGPAAQAARAPSLAQVEQVLGHPIQTAVGGAVVVTRDARDSLTALNGTQGGGDVAVTNNAQPASSSGTGSTSTWIAIGAALAALVVGLTAWALLRRRRPDTAQAYCAEHPEDPACSAA